MIRTTRHFGSSALVVMGAIACAPAAQAALVVNLDVPLLGTAGNQPGFEFGSFQFNVYLVPQGDPTSSSDFSAYVDANDVESFTFLSKPPCGGGGKGGGNCSPPPPPVRTAGSIYQATTQLVSSPPTTLDVLFHFSGADVAGRPLVFDVQHSGSQTLKLTADAGHVPVSLGAPLSNGLYTLEYKADDLQSARISITSPVPEPTTRLLFLPGLLVLAAAFKHAGVRRLKEPPLIRP